MKNVFYIAISGNLADITPDGMMRRTHAVEQEVATLAKAEGLPLQFMAYPPGNDMGGGWSLLAEMPLKPGLMEKLSALSGVSHVLEGYGEPLVARAADFDEKRQELLARPPDIMNIFNLEAQKGADYQQLRRGITTAARQENMQAAIRPEGNDTYTVRVISGAPMTPAFRNTLAALPGVKSVITLAPKG